VKRIVGKIRDRQKERKKGKNEKKDEIQWSISPTFLPISLRQKHFNLNCKKRTAACLTIIQKNVG
jgi:hypothetical protein